MFNLINEVVHKLDSQRCAAGIFFDLRKAFHSVDLLLEKMEGCEYEAWAWTLIRASQQAVWGMNRCGWLFAAIYIH